MLFSVLSGASTKVCDISQYVPISICTQLDPDYIPLEVALQYINDKLATVLHEEGIYCITKFYLNIDYVSKHLIYVMLL